MYVKADEDIYLYYQSKGVCFANGLEDFDGLHAGMLVGKRDRSAKKYQSLKDQHFSLANHCGIIPSYLWLACQYKLEQNRQLGRTGQGKHTWMSGLLKCASCGYSVKVNRDKNKYYLTCSGRSNLGLCSQSIRMDLRELEAGVAAELEQLLEECPALDAIQQNELESAAELEAIHQKIEHLMDALSEGSDLTVTYINKKIQHLEEQRQAILAQQEKQHAKPRAKLDRLKFATLDFEQKKLVAAQFIQQIQLHDDTANVIWNI